MIVPQGQKSVFRFAPSPNGPLHLGHALSACLNSDMAAKSNGRLLLRIEDIDRTRCTPEFERAMIDDLEWLGMDFEHPFRRQSDHFADYAAALETLLARGLAYPSFMTRGAVRTEVAVCEAQGRPWPRDPVGTPLYPQHDRHLSTQTARKRIDSGEKHAWRLNMEAALSAAPDTLTWQETGDGLHGDIPADPAIWGDIVLSRPDAPSSYHLSVTVDDALQGITHVVRGMDLFHATSAHRLLQVLLGLPAPMYHHHRLILGDDGRKLSKSDGAAGLSALRDNGLSPADIRTRIGL